MRTSMIILIMLVALLFASCGGGGTTTIDPSPSEPAASISGYLTQDGINERSVSAADTNVTGAEVWCENPATGEVLGQDATDANGYFEINNLPTQLGLKLQFRFQAAGGASEVEGETEVVLSAGERQRIDLRIRQHDADGNGETDAVDGERAQGSQRGDLTCNVRPLISEDLPVMPETNEIAALLRATSPDAEPLPALPMDDEEDTTKDSSQLPGEFTVEGPDYLRMHNGQATDTSLVLDASEHRLAWGLYTVNGLDGQDIASLSIECAPLNEGGKYFIGVSNYSRLHWEWSGPVTSTEFTFEVNQYARHISPRGNLYFVMAVFGDDSCEFFSGQATPRELEAEALHPAAPIHIEASDGQTANGIAVHWRVHPRASELPVDNYIVLRAETKRTISATGNPSPEHQFVEIGDTSEQEYFDPTASEGAVYLYAVVAIANSERSGRSNVDRGFWVVPVTSERYTLGGTVVTEDGSGVGGVQIRATHGEHAFRTITDENGHFEIKQLSAGTYAVTPHMRNMNFAPESATVELPLANEVLVQFIASLGGNHVSPGN